MARESISRCLSFAALEPWLSRGPKSARRKGGTLSHSTELSEPRYVLSALPVSPILGDGVSFPETTSEAAAVSDFGQDPQELIQWDVAWDEISAIDIGFGRWQDSSDTEVENGGTDNLPDDKEDLIDDGSIEIDFGIELPDDPEPIQDGLDGLESLEPEVGGDVGDIQFSTSLDELLGYVINNEELLPALNARAANGEFGQIFPVFSVASGAISLETFPQSIPPLEVSIAIGDQAEDVLLPTSENTINVHLEELGSWLSGSPAEQIWQVRQAAVQALTMLVPDVPVLLTMNSVPMGTQRFIVMDGFGYPMSRQPAELDPRMSGDGEIEIEVGEASGLEEDPVIPPVVSSGSQTTSKDDSRRPEPEPAQPNQAPVIPQPTSPNRSVLVDQSTTAPAILVVNAGFDDAGVFGDLDQTPALPVSSGERSWGTAHPFPSDWRLTFGEQWAARRAYRLAKSNHGKAARQDRMPVAEALGESQFLAPAGSHEQLQEQTPGNQHRLSSARIIQSPLTADLTTTVVSTRQQLLPSSSQIQLRRYRIGHRQAVAAEYAEIPLRETIIVSQERLEDNAPSQLRYVVNPRAPPRGPPRSEYLKENFADNDLLERLRYSIAPRGPSLADSSSLSPGSVFFSGPRVSPVFSCQLGC